MYKIYQILNKKRLIMTTTSLTLDEIYDLAFKVLKDNGCDEFNAKMLLKQSQMQKEMEAYLMDCLEYLAT